MPLQKTSVRVLVLLVLGVAAATQARSQDVSAPITGSVVPCVEGKAAGFDCRNVDLLSFLPIHAIVIGTDAGKTASAPVEGAATARASLHPCEPGDKECELEHGYGHVQLNDIWGWTDPETRKEYAIVGLTSGTSFVDISSPTNPVYLGTLPGRGGGSPWRDVKVYRDHAFVVADAIPTHGMQVFDLRQLRNVASPPVVFAETAHYAGFGNAHNLYINEESGYAYAVGTNTFGGGLHIVDITEPASPAFAGSFSDPRTGRLGTGYTHDVQCVNYGGPDSRYQDREICFGSNETAFSISDVSDKENTVPLAVAPYPQNAYAHQGWLTGDQRFFLMDDELDEINFGFNTRTIVWDVSDLQNPKVHAVFNGTTGATDHNQYVVGTFSYQANYRSGLRIIDLSGIATADTNPSALREAAYFDTFPADNLNSGEGFDGAWSNYPYFESGIVVVSSIGQGLFVLKPNGGLTSGVEPPDETGRLAFASAYPNPLSGRAVLVLNVPQPVEARIALYDVLGREAAVLYQGRLSAGRHRIPVDASAVASGRYVARVTTAAGTATQILTVVR